MTEPPRHPDSSGGDYPGAPRWVKVLGVVAVVLILLFILLMVTGGPAGHGPGRHMQP